MQPHLHQFLAQVFPIYIRIHMNIRLLPRTRHICRCGILYLLLCPEGSLHASLVNLKVLARARSCFITSSVCAAREPKFNWKLGWQSAKVSFALHMALNRCRICAQHIRLKRAKSEREKNVKKKMKQRQKQNGSFVNNPLNVLALILQPLLNFFPHSFWPMLL